jgi:hypothetical protein
MVQIYHNNNNNNLFHVLIDPDTGIDTIQGYRMSHKFKTSPIIKTSSCHSGSPCGRG